MCGNGARCFALFVRHLGLCGETCRFEATDGPHEAQLQRVDGPAGEIELGMIPVSEIRAVGRGWSLNTGVPHYVEFVDAVDTVDVCGRGRGIRSDAEHFPQGTNVDFVEVSGSGKLRRRGRNPRLRNGCRGRRIGRPFRAATRCTRIRHRGARRPIERPFPLRRHPAIPRYPPDRPRPTGLQRHHRMNVGPQQPRIYD